ncbi:uncharacterized protein LOC131801476 [Musca domestica]|uniref:Uncharacterized protein LOC101887796 n=1 Tax=Musca domestica TaxID=7370 RepID=A0A1I8MVU9_MUSDO|nr:uncharacterized protein LOC101887796 [Musca domestica]XP_058976214.1 uncharacterized protein LOC131801476 [Musca domestica]
MKRSFSWITITLLLVLSAALNVRADLFECDDKILPSLSEIPGIGPKIASSEDTGDKVKGVFKEWGCKFKKTASDFGDNVKEKTKQLGEDVRDGFKKLTEKSKELHTKFESKFHDFKDHLSKDSAELVPHKDKKFVLENVEMINPEKLKADQECGHGFILDVLGNCKQVRK